MGGPRARKRKGDSKIDPVVEGDLQDVEGIDDLLAKARVLTGKAKTTQDALAALNNLRQAAKEAKAVTPRYDPEALALYAEVSEALRTNIDGYVTNIESHGHRFDPVVDLQEDGIREKIRRALAMDKYLDTVDIAREKLAEARNRTEREAAEAAVAQAEEQLVDPATVTDEQVDTAIADLRLRIDQDRFLATAWFNNCATATDHSFENLRRLKRAGEEAVGHAAWECLRDSTGRLRRLKHIASHTVYPVALIPEDTVSVSQSEMVSPVTWRDFPVDQVMPRYVQIDPETGTRTYFKTLGDPRVISQVKGLPYEDDKALQEAERDEDADVVVDVPHANEVIWFDVHSDLTPAGVPRWIGALLEVLGNRGASEVNYTYLDNKAVPPALLMVDGRLRRGARERIKQFFKVGVKGRRNWDRVAVIDDALMDAAPNEDAKRRPVEFISLMDLQRGDALFREYRADNRDVIGANFRQPAPLRGEVPKDLNRATYYGALRFGEEQVYAPERNAFDAYINATLMPALGFRYVRFRSNSPVIVDPEMRVKLLEMYSKYAGVNPAHLRVLAADDFNMPQLLEGLDAAYLQQPLQLTLATGGGAGETAEQVEMRLAAIEDMVAADAWARLNGDEPPPGEEGA